jgi:transposase
MFQLALVVKFKCDSPCCVVMQRGGAMGTARSIRTDIPADELRRLARQESNGQVACRLLAVANALAGMSREDAARQAGMDRRTLRDSVIRFNAEGVEGLRDRPKSGRPNWLDDDQLATLKALVLRGPDPERNGVSTWRAKGSVPDCARPLWPQLYRERHAPAAPRRRPVVAEGAAGPSRS